jgi:twitching motility protein PilT
MWRKRRSPAAETRSLLAKLRARAWKSDAERDALLAGLDKAAEIAPEDVAWMAADADAAVRKKALESLARFPLDEAAEAIFPELASRSEPVRKAAMQALETLAGPSFPTKMEAWIEHRDPAVVHAALDYARRNPSERVLPGVARALAATSPSVRRKAFAIVESLAATVPRAAALAARALEDDDEELRYRAIALLARNPTDSAVAALLKRCHNESPRVQEAAVTALTPLLTKPGAPFHPEILPLLSDGHVKVRQLAVRILQAHAPETVAVAFLQTFRGAFGSVRDRSIQAISDLGPTFVQALIAQDRNPDPGIASLAAAIAVSIRSPEVVPSCVRYLDGDDFWLRERAARLLAELKDPRGLPPLLKLLDHPESNLSAANALGAWGTPEVLPGLLAAYKKGAADLRLEILDAFGRIPDARVGPLLESIVKADPDAFVKEKAARLSAERSGSAAPSATIMAGARRQIAPVDFSALKSPELTDLLRHARAVGASDLHVAAGTIPHVRVHGALQPLPLPEIPAERIESWILPILSPERQKVLASARQLDFCHRDPELGRFRTNVFFQRKGANAVFRLIPEEVPTLADIDLPESLWELTTYSQGLVLVTGAGGCGKTTTLAALVDRINETQKSHILTVEDPIEYVHRGKLSLVNQREVPTHTESFAKALRQALREDPDVILVGEMRDLETIALAITASETGHLVLATLHTTTASATVDRIINSFPPDQQGQIRMMISDSLKAVISQTLLPRRDGSGRVAAFEILRNTPNVAGLIREGKTFQIPTAIQTGAAAGMVLMDGALRELVQKGVIDARVAYDHALRKEAFEAMLAADEGTAA